MNKTRSSTKRYKPSKKEKKTLETLILQMKDTDIELKNS